MRGLQDHLSQYAAYHRDRRNIATHYLGIPMIVVAITTLLSRPAFELGGLVMSPSVLVTLGALAFYLRLDARYGAGMALVLSLALWAGRALAAETTLTWLLAGFGLFLVGWGFQFLGHYYEGKKPAFVDDLMGLLVGPLFVLAEAGFHFGIRNEVRLAIEERVGPTLIRARPVSPAQQG